MSQNKWPTFAILLFCLLPGFLLAQPAIPDRVLEIFEDNCAFAGCHAGPNAPRGLDLTEDFALSALLNVPSKDQSNYVRVKPGDPVNSYLMMKLKGGPDIVGERMPKGSAALADADLAAIEAWIQSLPAGSGRVAAPPREFARAFAGVTSASIPTTQMLEPGWLYFRVAHRWRGAAKEGFDQLFGLDFGSRVFLDFGFALGPNLMFNVGRFAYNATFEFGLKWRFLRERTDGSVPISAAIRAGVDWETLKVEDDPNLSIPRSDSRRFHWFVQLPLSKQFANERLGVTVSPGVLFNPSIRVSGEAPIVTLAFAGRVMLLQDLSFFVEAVPILSGAENADVVGGVRINEKGESVFYDAWTAGFEKKVGGHVFHVYITNSQGLSTNTYMSGGDLDFNIFKGNFRFGFNIYRNLHF